VHIEQVSDVLWPDATLSVARGRVNTVVYRLRRVLRPGGGDIVRTGDLVSLELGDVDIDLITYRQALLGDETVRTDALAAVRGNLCHAQFPYDEWFVAARNEFAATWVDHARRALRGGSKEIDGFQPALTALGLTAEHL
jgi:DNA-binding SARP family transcriptional activator